MPSPSLPAFQLEETRTHWPIQLCQQLTLCLMILRFAHLIHNRLPSCTSGWRQCSYLSPVCLEKDTGCGQSQGVSLRHRLQNKSHLLHLSKAYPRPHVGENDLAPCLSLDSLLPYRLAKPHLCPKMVSVNFFPDTSFSLLPFQLPGALSAWPDQSQIQRAARAREGGSVKHLTPS